MTSDQHIPGNVGSGIDGSSCPTWCVEAHEVCDIHRTARVEIPIHVSGGHVSARAGLFGLATPEVVVHAFGVLAGKVAEANVYLAPDGAGNLAAMIEILARATPEDHLALAAIIRGAVNAVTAPPAS